VKNDLRDYPRSFTADPSGEFLPCNQRATIVALPKNFYRSLHACGESSIIAFDLAKVQADSCLGGWLPWRRRRLKELSARRRWAR